MKISVISDQISGMFENQIECSENRSDVLLDRSYYLNTVHVPIKSE